MRLRAWLAGLLTLCVLASGCGAPGFDQKVDRIIEPYFFSLTGWELATIGHEVINLSRADGCASYNPESVLNYFTLSDNINDLQARLNSINLGLRQGDAAALDAEIAGLKQQSAGLAGDVQLTIGTQIRNVLIEEGIYVPFGRDKLTLPPLVFRLIDLPTLLVISPRDRIEPLKEITLQPGLSDAQREDIEKQVAALDVSALVVDLGGLGGTFPTMVADVSGLEFTVTPAAHEWLHQYLAFQPLGFLYVLHELNIRPDYDIATMNETVVSLVSEEIAARVMAEYYPQPAVSESAPSSAFDFNQAMRDIRHNVDRYLADGQVAEAEAYMDNQRDELAAHGYYIRKLNQAYFAFHGTYAASPTSISPIGAACRELRRQSASLKDFLVKAAALTKVQELEAAVK